MLLWCCSVLALAAPRGVGQAPVTPEAVRQGFSSRTALVFGIDRYSDREIPDLAYADNDAEAMEVLLQDPSLGDFDAVDAHFGRPVTHQEFWEAFDAATAELQPDDTFLLYFAGHGTLVPTETGWALYLLTSDSTLSAPDTTAISLAELEARFSALPARQRVFILDACHNTGNTGRSQVSDATRGLSPRSPGPIYAREAREAEARLYAATEFQAAWEDRRLGHGVYTSTLLDALSGAGDRNGDGLITVEEAHSWAETRTREHTRGHQSPMIQSTRVARETIYLTGPTELRTSAEQSLIDSLATGPHPTGGSPRQASPTPQWTLEAGGGGVWDPTGDVTSGWRLNQQLWRTGPQERLALGLQLSQALGVAPTAQIQSIGTAELRGFAPWGGPRIAIGPELGIGLIGRMWAQDGLEAGLLVSGGVRLRGIFDPLVVSLTPRLDLVPMEEAPSVRVTGGMAAALGWNL